MSEEKFVPKTIEERLDAVLMGLFGALEKARDEKEELERMADRLEVTGD